MKLILNTAVEHLGDAGDVVEVKDGYGRNYLLPRGLAIPATEGAIKQADEIRRAQKEREIRDRDHAREIRDQLDVLTGVTIAMRTSGKGKLFGSVSRDDIADAVEKAGGPKLDKHTIDLPKRLVKSTGKYRVLADLAKGIQGKIDFEVVSV
ncbi:50S ribosomal protein L9 [Corynebacterium otitidis]|uniref:Large ribosomal subunit protein bL9 n=1 Tax=Corynebacterium otitidis ATCC 51513 TaxID=883169 RepID=I7LCF7_9CORY|nr:50S ribosomal protein L9 [Corynebacterium otitidis]EJZ81260.1 ribosomal protein L9 [Corynebacterium otitidis ATCC 51513]CCI83919.1 50S ribosomal protein L9 [Corynebacterium otitidis ATCC 51513]